MDTYCWIHGTFSIPSRWGGEQGVDVPHPGVAPDTGEAGHVYHRYYQWVCYVLFLQVRMYSDSQFHEPSIKAGLFYIPRFLWKNVEGGRMNMLVNGMFEPKLVVDRERRSERISTIVTYIQTNRGQHSFYFLKFLACEALNFANVISQMFLMDK